MSGSLPPDLQGTFFRVGPSSPWATGAERPATQADEADGLAGAGGTGDPGSYDNGGHSSAVAGALHAMELRDGKAVWYQRQDSEADAGVLWHAGSLLALPEAGIPSQYSRFLEPQDFAGRLTVPIASHVHRLASDGGRILFGVEGGYPVDDGGGEDEGIFLRIGEWDAAGALRAAQSVELERATWQHDIGVTAEHVVFIESPTTRLSVSPGSTSRVPFGWVPGADSWIGVVPRHGDGTAVRWIRLDPCLVTHVLGAYDGAAGAVVLYVCRYGVPEQGQPVDLSASVMSPAGIGLTGIGGTLGVLERWRIQGERVERVQLDDRFVEYPRIDARCEGASFRYGYALETAWAAASSSSNAAEAAPIGVLQFDLAHDEVVAWSPGAGRTPSEPLFVRAADGHADDEGWLLTIVDNPDRSASDLYVLDASSLGRGRPEAVVHLPERLPVRSHGEWVPADRYR
jgi:carotenoid cleavage dioxygenase